MSLPAPSLPDKSSAGAPCPWRCGVTCPTATREQQVCRGAQNLDVR
jgi:hypothetical protein